jgi:hypothetical protein
VKLAVTILVAFAALTGSTPSVTGVRGSGVVDGDGHHPGVFKSGRFALSVSGRHGWIRYVNHPQHLRFASTKIGLFRDETTSAPTVALAGTGRLNGESVRFYVRCIDAGGPLEDVFYVNFRDRDGFWLSEAGGRIWSGEVDVR